MCLWKCWNWNIYYYSALKGLRAQCMTFNKNCIYKSLPSLEDILYLIIKGFHFYLIHYHISKRQSKYDHICHDQWSLYQVQLCIQGYLCCVVKPKSWIIFIKWLNVYKNLQQYILIIFQFTTIKWGFIQLPRKLVWLRVRRGTH